VWVLTKTDENWSEQPERSRNLCAGIRHLSSSTGIPF
jgi:hypothetical protein